ncbi:MAG: DNA-deoxyinosine glycosylase [Clostridiales bacterium]|nr:DNA-deoxyinosine glycosylase [Clostridiales bacterium]
MNNIRHATHGEVPPIVDFNSKVLVLGSMLSPKSSEARFYYAHPQNRFWQVLSAVLNAPLCAGNDDRKKLALTHGIALWDVIDSCDIVGANDSTIKNVVYNDIVGLLNKHENIVKVFTTGGKAHELLLRYNRQHNNKHIAAATRLPSTSPLNCAAKLDDLIEAYKVINEYL